MIRKAHVLYTGRVGAILSEFIDITDWMPRIHSRAEDTEITGFIARDQSITNSLYVTASTHQKGIRKALLNHAKSISHELTLWTFVGNENAQKFYKSAGFIEVERTGGAGNEKNLPDIRFYWTQE